MSADGFHMKFITNTEKPFSNRLQEACSGFQEAACFRKPPAILKIVPKVDHECTLEKFNQ
jgi:hypothetical protein